MCMYNIKNKICSSFSEEDLALIKLAINSFICDGRNMLFLVLVSLVIDRLIATLIYIVIISLLRVHTGGWHAKSKSACFLAYFAFYVLYIFCISLRLSKTIYTLITLLCGLYMVVLTPIEHPLNPLTKQERIINHRYVVFYIFIFTVLFFKYRLFINCVPFSFLINSLNIELLRYNSSK